MARRLIKIVCATTENICNDENDNLICTTNGICGNAFADLLSGSVTQLYQALVTTKVVVPLPTLTLLGDLKPIITAGDFYDRCASSASKESVCDRGGEAFDPVDKYLDSRIMVCGQRLYPAEGKAAVPILVACGINSDKNGTYIVKYSVSNSAGMTEHANRTLIIKISCEPGTFLCNANALQDFDSCIESATQVILFQCSSE
jgi:hypothetical protein